MERRVLNLLSVTEAVIDLSGSMQLDLQEIVGRRTAPLPLLTRIVSTGESLMYRFSSRKFDTAFECKDFTEFFEENGEYNVLVRLSGKDGKLHVFMVKRIPTPLKVEPDDVKFLTDLEKECVGINPGYEPS